VRGNFIVLERDNGENVADIIVNYLMSSSSEQTYVDFIAVGN